MKISIVIPVYNAENCLERCVNSIIEQHLECEYEILLVEDYSQDGSLECCNRLKEKYSNVIVLRTNGKGVSAARNTGLASSTGDIIGFCDSDDLYESNTLNKIRELFLGKNNIDIIVGGYYYSRVLNNRIVNEEIHSYKLDSEVDKNCFFNLVLNDSRILGSVCNKFYRRKVIEKMLFPTDISYCEDLYFNIKVIENLQGLKCLILGTPIYHYIRNGESATNTMEKLFDENLDYKYIIALRKLYDYAKDGSEKRKIGYKIETLALDFLYHNKIYGIKNEHMWEEIRKYKQDFFKEVLSNFKIGSWKWCIKIIMVYARQGIYCK